MRIELTDNILEKVVGAGKDSSDMEHDFHLDDDPGQGHNAHVQGLKDKGKDKGLSITD